MRPPKESTERIPVCLEVAGYLALAMSACVTALYLYSAFTKLTGP